MHISKETKIKIINIAILFIGIGIVFCLYSSFNSKIFLQPSYKLFQNASVGGTLIPNVSAHEKKILLTNTTFIQEYLNLSNKTSFFANISGSRAFFASVNGTKALASNYLNSSYSSVLQIILAVSTTLFGLYALLFFGIVEVLHKRNFKSTFLNSIKYVIILLAILPFPYLLASISNIYSSFSVFQNLLISSSTYFSLVYYANPSSVTYYPNSTVYFYLKNNTGIIPTIIPTSNSAIISPSFLYREIIDFVNVSSGIFIYLEWAIVWIMVNLFVICFYFIITKEGEKEKNR